MHVFVARSTIVLAIVYQLMICFVFIVLLSFTIAFRFISSFSTPLPVHLRLLKFLCSFILLRQNRNEIPPKTSRFRL